MARTFTSIVELQGAMQQCCTVAIQNACEILLAAPKREYLLLLAHPARNILKTGKAASIRYKRMLVPVFTKVNSELYGNIPNAANIGTKTNIGARLNKNLSALSGVIFSLHNNLKASATVCKIPQIPALFGPFR